MKTFIQIIAFGAIFTIALYGWATLFGFVGTIAKAEKSVIMLDTTYKTRGGNVYVKSQHIYIVKPYEKVNLFKGAMTANAKQMQDVVLMAEEKEVSTHFVFSLDAKQSKKLQMYLVDEEGYEVVGKRDVNIGMGKNYRALNVSELPQGSYTLQLFDEDGSQLKTDFTIQ